MLKKFAYVGDGYFCDIISLLLSVVVFLDADRRENNYTVVKITSLLGNAVVIILSATALYISCMSVGIDSIGGMQGRYLVLIIYLTLYSLGIGGATHRIFHNTFVCVPILIVAAVFICDIFKLCLLQYWRIKMKRGMRI